MNGKGFLMRTSLFIAILFLGAPALLAACGNEAESTTGGAPEKVEQALFVAHEGSLISYDIATGKERPGAVQDVAGPVDLQALSDGTVMVNLTGRDEVLCVDGVTMLERARIPSSAKGGTRPVHSYLAPEHDGKTYWLSLNDGAEGKVETNSALFVDATIGSSSFMDAKGEVGLGIGHHKAAFSAAKERVVISNIADCDNVLSVYDYSDIASIKLLATLSAKDAGWDGSSFAKTCDPTYKMGLPPAPHGCATSMKSGKAYCNLTSSGDIVVIDIDADPPVFSLLPTGGSGGGYTKAGPGGDYIYSLEETPREGDMDKPGADCQIGQLVTVDAAAGEVVSELPLLYTGPDCKAKLAGTDEETANPGHIQISNDGKTMFITPAGGFGVDTARVRQELVVDLSVPSKPAQRASIPVGASVDHHGDALSGDGKWLFVTNNADGSVTQIDVAKLSAAQTIKTNEKPETVATFGTAEGPSKQTGPLH